MRFLPPKNWVPVEIDALEPAAETVVRDLASGVVVAGPGAGKTELLAQRACFLFQTGLCRAPKRILAISFKRDAASNLRKRVRQRCGTDLSRCFDSMTFDSFSKGLVDRFLAGLPDQYRPSSNYCIDLQLESRAKLRSMLNQVSGVDPGLAASIVNGGFEERFFKRFVVGKRLDSTPASASSENDRFAAAVWQFLLQTQQPSRVSFTMIGRLAELLLRSNPKVLKALRQTYAFVFLDEFQDTTRIQYDLTVTAFKDSGAKLTAVGDPKQRIMLWAGALKGIFRSFQEDFQARHHALAMNYRSAPELVRIQKHLISALEPTATPPRLHRTEKGGECRVFVYPDHESEAKHLARYLGNIIRLEKLLPSDVCVLTRTWNQKYSTLLINELSQIGVTARLERELQDLLADPIVNIVLRFLRFSLSKRSPTDWDELLEICFDLWGIEGGTVQARRAEQLLCKGRNLVQELVRLVDTSKESVLKVLSQIVSVLNEKALKQVYPQYRQGTYFSDLLNQTASHIQCRLDQEMSWLDAINDFEGLNSIPIMTVHKSKGLEYHTVVFVGLEDSALWNFQKSPEEEKCGFFVAFSRAIKRVVFTFSEYRPRRMGARPERQTRQTIGTLYTLLEEAGIVPEDISSVDDP